MKHEPLDKQIERLERERAKEPGKTYGECDSCGQRTVLVTEIGMCGPCTFGEAETVMGNW